MGRGPSVTKEEYNYGKQLLSLELPIAEVAERIKRSKDTVRCISYSTDYDDYVSTPTKEMRKRRKTDNQYQIRVEDVYDHEEVQTESASNDEVYAELVSDSLSAEDKKEIAKYIIDQHYLFLKQLTGVI